MSSGDTLDKFTPHQHEPHTTNLATVDVVNERYLLDFADDSNNIAKFTSIMPQNYEGNGLTCKIHYSMSSDNTNDVVLAIGFEKVEDNVLDITTDSFAAVNSVIDTVPGTLHHKKQATITFTNGADMDNIVAGDQYRFYIIRLSSSGDDDASGDLELHAIEMRET